MTGRNPGGEPTADWRQRFRAHAVFLSEIAIDAPATGLVTTNASGLAQLSRWNPLTGELTQITHEPKGRLLGKLSPDRRDTRRAGGDDHGRRDLRRRPAGRRIHREAARLAADDVPRGSRPRPRGRSGG